MLLILMCGDVAMNPGLVMLGSVNARSMWNKGPLLADTIASHAFDFLCLIETYICTTDLDSFLCSLTPDGFSLIHRPCSSGIGGGVGFFIRDSYRYRKMDTANYRGPRWQSGNTLASHLCGRGSIPVMAISAKAGSCLPLVGSLQYRTLANYMYWFPLPFQLPIVI